MVKHNGGRPGRFTQDCQKDVNHDLRRSRDKSACVQLEEVLCAGREVLHGDLVSQAMSMCACV